MSHTWMPYCGMAPIPADLLGRWNFDPFLLLALAAATAAYLRLPKERRGSDAAFWSALAMSAVLFVSPFCALTSALFSARVVHHLILATVLAPLIVLALPRTRMRGSAVLWTIVQSAVFWLWHAPGAYSAALSSDLIYWTMQLSITGTAVLFWIAVRQSSLPSAVGSLLTTMVAMGLLGALITFAGHPLYAPHFEATGPWGLAALEDQQLAGLIMWAPGGGFYLAAALLLAGRWMRRQELGVAAS